MPKLFFYIPYLKIDIALCKRNIAKQIPVELLYCRIAVVVVVAFVEQLNSSQIKKSS
jgi:hypothetical protein